MFGHRMPGHLSPLGDGTVIRLVGAKPHVLPDLPLLFGEFLRRWDPSQPVQDCLPLGVQLLDQHLQFLLTLFTGMGVDTFGVLGAVRPSGGVTALKQVVIDLGNTPSAGLPGLSQHRLEVRSQVLLCLCGFLPHLVAQPPVYFGCRLALHIPGDMGIDVQSSGSRHMAKHGGEGLHIHTALQGQGGKSMP